MSVGVGETLAEAGMRVFHRPSRIQMAPGSAVLLAAVAAGRLLEISSGRQTLLLRRRMAQNTLAGHRTYIAGLG